MIVFFLLSSYHSLFEAVCYVVFSLDFFFFFFLDLKEVLAKPFFIMFLFFPLFFLSLLILESLFLSFFFFARRELIRTVPLQ